MKRILWFWSMWVALGNGFGQDVQGTGQAMLDRLRSCEANPVKTRLEW